MQEHAGPGERAILLLPQNLDYLASLFACFNTNIIAVPAYLSLRANLVNRINGIFQDAMPSIIITVSEMIPLLEPLKQYNSSVKILNVHQIDESSSVSQLRPLPKTALSSVAFLQYTSGSTGDPKGVMVSHTNLMANLAMMADAFQQDENSIFVNWLPLFHDMGLIAASLLSFYLGATLYLMPPSDFVKKPIRWLKAISDYQGTISYAPNFAYDMCVKYAQINSIEPLNLASWKVAINAAEPVRQKTLKNFTSVFSRHGFGNTTFCVAYGLAEATVYATSSLYQSEVNVFQAAPTVMQNRMVVAATDSIHTRSIVGCGKPRLDGKIMCVNLQTMQPCAPNEIGEIWLAGSHIPEGYWNKPVINKDVFQARLASKETAYLRTGDLGFIDSEGELYITGRLKDLIIIHGKNFAAHDVEECVGQAHSILHDCLIAAFSIEQNDEEQLIVMVEIDEQAINNDANHLTRLIKQKVNKEFEIIPANVIFVKKNVIGKTTSGKIQRQKAKKDYLANKILAY